MGIGVMCYLGFSITYGNSFSELLERLGGALQRHQREAAHDLDLGLEALHGAVDAALAGDVAGDAIDRGLELLASSNDHLTGAAEALVQARAQLFEREAIDPDDPLLARERYFAAIDYDAVYKELAAHGAAAPHQVHWQDLVGRLRDGGARAGLRLLDRHHRELQSDLRALIAEISAVRGLSGRHLAETIHGASRSVATLVVGFSRIAITCSYLSVLCERASMLQGRSGSELAAAG